MSERICIDCDPEKKPYRPIHKDSGPRTPRCATHLREFNKGKKDRRHKNWVSRTYGEEWGELYDELHEWQGGVCAICLKATGKSKRLAVDHDHETGEVRGLLCSQDNLTVLGRLDIEGLKRAIAYLEDPPARRFLKERDQ